METHIKPSKSFTDACDKALANGVDSCGICQNYPIKNQIIITSGEKVYYAQCNHYMADSVYIDIESSDIVERWEQFASECQMFKGY